MVVRTQEPSDELLTQEPLTAMSRQWHRKHTSIRKKATRFRWAVVILAPLISSDAPAGEIEYTTPRFMVGIS
jgi:hypothetical protein